MTDRYDTTDDARAPDTADRSAAGEPVAEEPAAERPAAEEPAAERPAAERPAAEEPVAERRVAEQPVAERPGAERRVVEDTADGRRVVGDTAAERPAAEEPVAERPVAERPVAERPVAERPVATDAAVDPVASRRAGATARARHGGFDWVATFLGFAVAVFFLAVFLGIVGAIVGTGGYRTSTGSVTAMVSSQAGIFAAAGTLVALFLAYFFGGYAAGRLARYDGVVNGLGVVLWTVIVAIALSIAGAVLNDRFQVAQQLHLGISLHDLTVAGVISAVVTLIVMVIGAAIGGGLGTHYHRRVDRDLGAVD